MAEELFINSHIRTFMDKGENGVKMNSGRYERIDRTVNTSSWSGRNINFQIDNLSLNKLIVGNRCFITFNCTATQNDGLPITSNDIWLRDGVGNLIIQTMDVKIGGVTVYNNGFADITRHFYEHLNNPNSKRMAGEYQDRFIDDENKSFAGQIVLNANNLNSISSGKEFIITRPLTDITFFGDRDSAIPAGLPITINMQLNSSPGRVFASSVPDEPKLHIITATLHMYYVELEDSHAAVIQEALRSDSLPAYANTWHSMLLGSGITAGNTNFNSDQILMETTPDVVGIALLPKYSYHNPLPHGLNHTFLTTWNNTTRISITTGGSSIREYNNLGDNGSIGTKYEMARELESISDEGSINKYIYGIGNLSFFPVVFRSLKEETVLPPKPMSLKFNLTMGAGTTDAVVTVFYKVRHQWKLSLQTGGTQILR